MQKGFTKAGFLKALGPGILFAGAAIGVSHVVQSTRAGAEFGFALLWLILLANFLKFPFFEFGPRYAAATGESLIDGYRRVGRWAFVLFLVLTVLTMFTIQAGVTVVAAALAENLFNFGWSVTAWSALILGVIGLLLVAGKYPWLDRVTKVIVAVLAAATLTAVVLAALNGPVGDFSLAPPELMSAATFAFVIALLGWMPANFEISVWQSLWAIERAKETGHRPSMKEALADFHVGYWLATLYAVLFVALGALMLYGTGEAVSGSSVGFSAQLVGLFTAALGEWTWPVIATAVFVTMFSTTLTVTDAYPRVWRRSIELIAPEAKRAHETLYWVSLLVVGGGALLIIAFLGGSLTKLVDLAASISFISAPLFGYLGYRAVTHPHVPKEARPGRFVRVMALLGGLFVSLFAIGFVLWRLLG